ncbi:MAG: type II toxin-antitoxin system VapC family toxin [Thermaerobacter sp.]|jgi:PIN domain nuclease of toxin-antitoxin system|nr:type II toxin-antitoxin system VapC family toxin [Thermaerobacter sp.]
MGMKLLLDTHTLLWALMEPDQLSPVALRAVEDGRNTLLVSAASAWEIATKHRLGRLPLAGAVVPAFSRHLKTLGADELPISLEHALLAGSLRTEHRDPFDRMLAAQALIEGTPLVSNDRIFDDLSVPVLW